ncbi:hypothetical protein FRC06_007188 [Ceratobasidium sp. 370]|nr:hypothetical protein FRC06_007188 [Ceratobasidium sp. 370]
MPSKSHRLPQEKIRSKLTTETTLTLAQHGSRLVQLPSELLTHLTAYLDPVTLGVLASVCRALAAHVGQDNTWRSAFLYHFLGVSPDPDVNVNNPKLLLLRRGESSWRAEFQKHWVMAKRWERTKAPTVTHRPHRTPLTTMHVMQAGKNTQGVPLQSGNCALLSASLATGMVMRSYPFSGKVVRGHFDASSTTTALGLGVNPNFQEAFSNVSALGLASTGGTGLVIWGLRSGTVAVTVAPRAMEVGCSARMIKCTLNDAHRMSVDGISVDKGTNGAEYFATRAMDGSVKLWNLPTSQRGQVSCVWTGGYADAGHVASDVASLAMIPCAKVAFSVSNEIVLAGYGDGTILVWFGVSPASPPADPYSVKCVHIPPPSAFPSVPTTLRLHAQSRTTVGILVHHSADSHFYRLQVDKEIGLVRRTRFGGGPLGPLSIITTKFTKRAKEDARTASSSAGPATSTTPAVSFPATPNRDNTSSTIAPLHVALPAPERGSAPRARSFIVAGDSLGRVCVWDWDGKEEPVREEAGETSKSSNSEEGNVLEVRASVVWDAADGESITALTWSDVVVAVGTNCGDTLIFDSLTQRLLKRISPPLPASAHRDSEGVSQIVIDGDVLLISVGEQVIAWQARKETGKSVNGWGKAGKAKKSKTGGTAAKWQQRNELNTEISRSVSQLKDERARSQPALRRVRAQAGALAEMGMDESEAVQYLMMLSRDEEEARQAAQSANASLLTTENEGEETGSSETEDGGRSPTHSDNSRSFYGSPTSSTRSSVPSTSTSPSSRRSGPSVYIPANGRPRSSVGDIGNTNGSPYGAYPNGRPYQGGGTSPDEDAELRMVLELSLLEQ